jgi:hypothetical protein
VDQLEPALPREPLLSFDHDADAHCFPP